MRTHESWGEAGPGRGAKRGLGEANSAFASPSPASPQLSRVLIFAPLSTDYEKKNRDYS